MTNTFSKTDLERLLAWENKLKAAESPKRAMEQWFFIHASGVLFADKPGELVIVKKNLFNLDTKRSIEATASFCKSWNLDFRMLDDRGLSLKIIVYNPPAINRRLAAASKKILHCVLKYPFGLDSTTFLAEVAYRWQSSGSIPHEIGIALGYPFKDVWGFMGISSEPCSGTCGWRIFGNPEPSIRRKKRYEQARMLASRYLEAA